MDPNPMSNLDQGACFDSNYELKALDKLINIHNVHVKHCLVLIIYSILIVQHNLMKDNNN